MTARHLFFCAAFVITSLALTACAEVAPESSAPSMSAAASQTATATIEPTAEDVIVTPSGDAGESAGDELRGMSLADATPQLLLNALQSSGVVFDEPATTGALTSYVGTADDGAVTLQLTARDGVAEQLVVTDTSGIGLSGTDEMGLLTTIFAPEANDWLFKQMEAALENPGTAFDASSDFDFVTLEISASTDERGTIELTVTDR